MSVGTRSCKVYAVAVRTGILAGSVAAALGLLGSSAALAQSCGTLMVGQANLIPPVAAALSGTSAVSAAVSAANTAFLTQSTAFVSAPANPKPDSEGAGIWIRGVGGELTLNSNTQVVGSANVVGAQPPGSTTCNTQFHQTFGGFQLGRDMAKLNVGGWNLTLGGTAGFLQTNGNIVGGNVSGLGGAFNSTTQAPFVGTYAVATYGNFFIDALVRADYFQTELNSPTSNFFNQKVDAHGFTATASMGYNWKVPNSSWFIEPSAGVVWSREAVDPINVASPLFANSPFLFSGTAQVNDIESIIGRLGVRVGTTLETSNVVYTPFVAVSVWHDFAGDVTANWASCPGCTGTAITSLNASMTSNNIGTFGQYSVGVSGQLKNTGWLGFTRVDYREGPEMHGLSATGGIRYQFTPTEVAGVMPVKAKAPVLADRPVNWSGWYVGAVGGATEFGRASMEFPGVTTADMRPSGWLGGGTLGYNYQVGKWVVGLEGDITGTNTNGSTQCAPLLVDPNNLAVFQLFQTTCHDELSWIGTATARLGYAWTPRSLLYVKAGGAFTNEKVSNTCNLGPNNNLNSGVELCASTTVAPFNGASASTSRAGWTVGVGSEFALTERWSIKGEFDWLDFGTKSLTLSDGTAINSTLRAAEGKIGLNYKFWP